METTKGGWKRLKGIKREYGRNRIFSPRKKRKYHRLFGVFFEDERKLKCIWDYFPQSKLSFYFKTQHILTKLSNGWRPHWVSSSNSPLHDGSYKTNTHAKIDKLAQKKGPLSPDGQMLQRNANLQPTKAIVPMSKGFLLNEKKNCPELLYILWKMKETQFTKKILNQKMEKKYTRFSSAKSDFLHFFCFFFPPGGTVFAEENWGWKLI